MRRRPFAVAALTLGLLLLAGLLVLWTLRFRIAAGVVDRRLTAAGVPASYRITRIGPFLERMEDVRIGDPAAPDLLARRIDVMLAYRLSGPVVSAIRVDGVRLRARYDANGLHLGALDRLLPQSTGGKTRLPDMALTLRDTHVRLATPNGAIALTMIGNGNPARQFDGQARVAAPALHLASCRLGAIDADLRVRTRGGRPDVAGPVRLAGIACPGMILGSGAALIEASADATFDHVSLQAKPSGFGGTIGPARFAGLSGVAEAAGAVDDLHGKARLAVRGVALPAAAGEIAHYADALAGTPVAPTGSRAAAAFARLLRAGDVQADLTASLRGTAATATVDLRQIILTGSDGAYLRAVPHGGLRWTAQGWRADADVSSGGGALPTISLALRQAAPGGTLTGTARLEPYRAGTARLAASPVRFSWNDGKARFATSLLIDGPVRDGFVRGLALPLRGYATTTGAVAIGQGCQSVAFAALQLTSFRFDPARLSVCGSPILSRSAGALRVDATAAPVRLTGRTTEGAPVAIGTARLRLTAQGFTAESVTASLGAGAQPTHLAIARLDGGYSGKISGQFEGAAGAIGNVPLVLADAGGYWTFDKGVLALSGKLMVRDAVADARFNPLATDDATLALTGGVITGRATLRAPSTGTQITNVRLEHDLSRGSGYALFDVPGIVFTPKGLQPEALTPLTLGVIANVAGTVSGSGRIDWGPQGVTSSGTFGTERTDLAAAFGPVTGIRGQIHLIDLLGLVSAPHQEATIAEINPGVAVSNGVVHYQLAGQSRVRVENATWPFAGGTLRLDPAELDFDARAERHLTFHVDRLDAAAFVQQLDFPNISATGTFDGVLPMIFDHQGGRIEAGLITARPGGGSLAYVGELSNAALGTMGKLAFDALKAIRYSSLEIGLDGRLDGEMISRVRFTGVREATPEQSLITRMIRNLPFRFNIAIRAPFRGLVGSARAYMDPRLLLTPEQLKSITQAEPAIQPAASGDVR